MIESYTPLEASKQELIGIREISENTNQKAAYNRFSQRHGLKEVLR